MQIRIQYLTSILLAATVFLPTAALAERSDWREMTVGHFELFSVLSDAATRDVARQLQGFEETVGANAADG